MSRLAYGAALAAAIAGSVSCGDVSREGRSPVFLVVDTLAGAPGNKVSSLGTPLISSVITAVTTPAPCTAEAPCLFVFNDVGQVVLRTPLKDVTNPSSPNAPTTNNEVTITRYRVVYRRADGRNTPGVDVPFPFDGAVTGTVSPGGTLTLGFELVRHDAKRELPLVTLVGSGKVISAIADVTFYGRDRVGNDINTTGSIQVDFGDFRTQ